MIMPLRCWKVHDGIRPWVGERWSVVFKTRPWGVFGRDWSTDATHVYDFFLFVLFDYKR